MIPRFSRCDRCTHKFDVMKIHGVEVIGLKASQTVFDTAAYPSRRVVEI